jgi:DNA-binding MarR family transcriptional regulator
MRSIIQAFESGNIVCNNSIREPYLQAVTLVERLHRRLLDVVKDELDRRGLAAINPVQALLLYNIGDQELSVGDLRSRGYYLGTNVSYNVKKLAEMEFVNYQQSAFDRRSVRIKITAKGQEVYEIVAGLYDKHAGTVEQAGGIDVGEFANLTKLLTRLERFWTHQVVYRM